MSVDCGCVPGHRMVEPQGRCADCLKVEMIRPDHQHTRYCADCALRRTKFPKGHKPHNFGSRERRRTRVCRTCGAEFEAFESKIESKPHGHAAIYCSKPCYSIAQQSPDSRHSQVKGRFRMGA